MLKFFIEENFVLEVIFWWYILKYGEIFGKDLGLWLLFINFCKNVGFICWNFLLSLVVVWVNFVS